MAVAATYFHLPPPIATYITVPTFSHTYCPYCRPLIRNICRPCTSRGNKWEPNVHKSYTLDVYVQHPLTHQATLYVYVDRYLYRYPLP